MFLPLLKITMGFHGILNLVSLQKRFISCQASFWDLCPALYRRYWACRPWVLSACGRTPRSGCLGVREIRAVSWFLRWNGLELKTGCWMMLEGGMPFDGQESMSSNPRCCSAQTWRSASQQRGWVATLAGRAAQQPLQVKNVFGVGEAQLEMQCQTGHFDLFWSILCILRRADLLQRFILSKALSSEFIGFAGKHHLMNHHKREQKHFALILCASLFGKHFRVP